MHSNKEGKSFTVGAVILLALVLLFGTVWFFENLFSLLLDVTLFTFFLLAFDRLVYKIPRNGVKNEIVLLIIGLLLFYYKVNYEGWLWGLKYLGTVIGAVAVFSPIKQWLRGNFVEEKVEG